MQPTHVVVPLNEFIQPLLQVLEITVGGRVDLFTLQRFEKAFARSIVIPIARVCSYWVASHAPGPAYIRSPVDAQ